MKPGVPYFSAGVQRTLLIIAIANLVLGAARLLVGVGILVK